MDDVKTLRGLSRLAVDAARGVTTAVEEMHTAIGSGPAVLGKPLAAPTRAINRLIYGSIGAVISQVGAGTDAALSLLEGLAPDATSGPAREAFVAALNGVVGDHLAATGNPLAIQMAFRKHGQPLELRRDALRARFPEATGKLLVLIHGAAMNDLQWNRAGHDHGASLSRDLGFTPVYLHYNTGLHVSENGHAFAALLETLVAQWPEPVDELVILAHSMGGLVARSACHLAEQGGQRWRGKLRRLVFLGTPHHGSHLERLGNWAHVLLGVSRYSVPIGKLARLRSAGVTDLRFGNVLDEHWNLHDRFAPVGDLRKRVSLPQGTQCYAIAATTAKKPGKRMPGDGLVPLDSALGRQKKAELCLDFPEANTFTVFATGHRELLSSPEVYAKLRSWLAR